MMSMRKNNFDWKNGTTPSNTLTFALFSLRFLPQHNYYKRCERCGRVGLLYWLQQQRCGLMKMRIQKVTAEHDG
jgi:hypothetical protein